MTACVYNLIPGLFLAYTLSKVYYNLNMSGEKMGIRPLSYWNQREALIFSDLRTKECLTLKNCK